VCKRDVSLQHEKFQLSSFSPLFLNRFHKGDVLITTATGVMSEEEGEKWGLVPTHAYAVLDIREYKVSSTAEDVFRCLFETCVCDG